MKQHDIEVYKNLACTFIVACLHAFIASLYGQSDSYPISSNHIELLRYHKDIPALNLAIDIIQGPSGHIWISGRGGLVRYNGSAFKVFNIENTATLQSEKFEYLASDHKNRIFVSSPSGVHTVSKGEIRRMEAMDSLNLISSMAVDKTAILWLVNNKKLYKYKDDNLSLYDLPEENIYQVIELNDRSVWAIGVNSIFKLSADGHKRYKTKTPVIAKMNGGGLNKEGLPFFISDNQDALILSEDQFVIAPWSHIFSKVRVKAVAQDEKGLIWTSGYGIFNTDFINVDSYNFSQLQFQNKTEEICIDRENTKWIIGEEGIWVIHESNVKSFYLEGNGDILFSKATSGILSLSDSTVLVGTNGVGIRYLEKNKLRNSDTKMSTGEVIYGLRKENEHFISFSNAGTFRFRFDGHDFYNLDTLNTDVTFLYFQDKNGTEFFNILQNNNRSVVYKKGNEFHSIPELKDIVFEIVETNNFGIVFCTINGAYALNNGKIRSLMSDYNIPPDECLTAWEDPVSGVLFIGTIGSGLIRISNGGVKIFNTKNGFPSNTVSNIFPYQNEMFLTGNHELFQFDTQDLTDGEADTMGFKNYFVYDLHHEVRHVGSDNIAIHNDKILVNTDAGISEINPKNKRDPFFNLFVEAVRTADSTFVAPASVGLAANDEEIYIDFSTIRYIDTKYSKFSYKLEGFEETWKSHEGLGTAIYPKLPSGSYVFRLREQHTNNEFLYADPVHIHKAIPWYLSGPMIVVYGIAVIFLVGRIVAFRTRVIKKQNEKLQAEVDRQTIALQDSIERTEETVVQRTRELSEAYKLLQEGEERLSRAFEISKDGIWDWNLQTDKITISNAVYTMLGYETYEFPAKLTAIINKVHPSDKTREEFKYLVDPEKIPEKGFETELRMAHKSDKFIWVKIKVNTYGRKKGGTPKRMVGVITDISSEKEKKKHILEAIIKTENLERSRISRDIHDGLQQTLTITQMNLNQLKKFMTELPQIALEKYDTCKDYLTRSIAESRNVAHNLMPRSISDLGLARSVETLVESMNESTETTNFEFRQNIENETIKNDEIIITLYRVLQEALNNVVKYAEASQVNVQLLKHEDILTMTVEDNGIGFDTNSTDKNSFGINSMSNRLDAIEGFLEIDSKIGTGTFLIAEVNNAFEIS